jgi:hypothetical protein
LVGISKRFQFFIHLPQSDDELKFIRYECEWIWYCFSLWAMHYNMNSNSAFPFTNSLLRQSFARETEALAASPHQRGSEN